MSKFPTEAQLSELAKELNSEKPLPNNSNAEEMLAIYSRAFRSFEDALAFANNIMLNDGEVLIGGNTVDSIGPLWWTGVCVDRLERWRSNGGFHHSARKDPEAPEADML